MTRVPYALWVGALVSVVFLIAALISLIWIPHPIDGVSIANRLQPASAAHPLGTDQLGRDVLSMLMVGAQTSIAVALIAVGIGIAVGVPLGLAAAANRGSLLDEIIMRGNDLIFAFPSLVIAILITARYGPSATNAILGHRHLQYPRLRPRRARRGPAALDARLRSSRPARPARGPRVSRSNMSCPTS
jgi:peptide/nickel transport system permease protein